MEAWIGQDPKAAWEHLKTLDDPKLQYSIAEFAHNLGKSKSSPSEWKWIAGQLAGMTSEEQVRLLKETNGMSESSTMSRLPEGFEDHTEKQRFRTNFVQTLADHGNLKMINFHARSIPKEERIEVLSGLRGIDQEGQATLEKVMTAWEIPANEVESTLSKIRAN